MNDAEIEADVVRLLRDGPLNALVFTPDELAAIDRLVARRQVIKDYSGPVGILGVYRAKLEEG